MSLNLPSNIDVCIAHSPCTDGFTAAWAVYRKYGRGVEFLQGCHEKGKDDAEFWLTKVAGKHVVVCDFSFSRELTERLHTAAASFTVLDHHASAQKELGDLPYCYFDMTRSGALIAWEELHKTEAPLLVQYVSDRDLWKNQMADSAAINTYLHRQKRSFHIWDQIWGAVDHLPSRQRIVEIGNAMLDCQNSLCVEMASKAVIWRIAGVEVWAANASCMASEVCDILGKSHPGPVAIYEIMGDTAKFSLRGNHGTEDLDVGALASLFPGGGGHKKASGFSIAVSKVDWINKRLDP